MINKTLLIASMLLFSNICNGQVAGKGLYCVFNGEINGLKYNDTIGIIFEEKEVKKYNVIRQDGKDEYSVIKKDMARQYTLESTYITWHDGYSGYALNRKDGILVDRYLANTVTAQKEYKCQVTAYESELEELMSELRDDMQDQYDKEREGNLI